MPKPTAIDLLLISRYDSIYTYPVKMKDEFKKAQKGLTDSTEFYKLDLFVGLCFYLQGNADSALYLNQKVLDFCDRYPGTSALKANAWNHRSTLLQGVNQKDSSIACLHHAYNAVYQSDDRRELQSICINLADAYCQTGDLPQAAKYYRKALWVVDSLGSTNIKFSIYLGLAQTYANLHNFPLAHHYFDLAEQNPEHRLEHEKYIFANSKGNCLYFEEKYAEALPYFQQAYQVVQNFSQPSLSALVEANLGEIFTLLGKTDSAHYYLDKSCSYYMNEPTANEEVVFYINSLQAALALQEDKLATVSNNQIKLSQQHNIIILVLALLIISVLLAILIFIHIRRKNEQRYNRQMALATQLRMENIRNRISPHYMFNVLNTVMPTFKQYSELAHPLQLLIQVLRGNLLASEKMAVELQEEIELVKNYIALRKETNPNTIHIEWEITEQVPLQTLIPSMSIQIPVENALKYAFEDNDEQTNTLSIHISKEDRNLSISIRDNGSGYDPGKHSNSKRSTGNGLKVLFRTIELLNSKNTEKIIFDIRNIGISDPSQHGTLVTITIPFNYQFNI